MNTIALVLLAQESAQRSFEWGRIQSNADWIAPTIVLLLIILFVHFMYRRDSVELRPIVGWFLTLLRVAAYVGLLLVWLKPQWRSERFEPQNSRLLLLVDTSLSMSLSDASTVDGLPANRLTPITDVLESGEWLRNLRRKHDVSVLRFDDSVARVATLEKLDPEESSAELQANSEQSSSLDWRQALAPVGVETRLGTALRQLIYDERAQPVSGVVVFSDGGQNAGTDVTEAIEMAREAKIPVFTVGLGSVHQPTNVRVADFVSPIRAHPGDAYTATAFIQTQGMAGQTATVELTSRAADSNDKKDIELEASEEITLGADGVAVPVKFVLTPDKPGRRTLEVRVRTSVEDSNARDDSQEVDIEIVDRTTKVLLIAGGPTREYRFLRTQLYRDPTTSVDVYLQSALSGISQEADRILDEFPSDSEELYEYDCIVAFDPAWHILEPAQRELLEKWVADEAGGLIVIAGPVYTQSWTQVPDMQNIRALYPVDFEERLSLLDDGRFGSTEPWPVEFNRAGMEAEFLWLADTATESARLWKAFPGMYGYYSVRGAKPAATVYAYFSDPRAVGAEGPPVYMAGHFYGAGRVFYLGSGEMWRLRSVDPGAFEAFYTKLIRHVSGGRLLRGSSRGTLLVERDRYVLGQTVVVRAQLSNAQQQPLTDPTVPLQVVTPGGNLLPVELTADPAHEGGYSGQFAARQEGVYRLEVNIPELGNDILSRRVQVRVPDVERENPRRNDRLLGEIASNTGGEYYVGTSDMLEGAGGQPLAEMLRDRTRTEVIRDAPVPLWNNVWVLVGLCSILCLEWFTRRLSRLA